MKKIIDFLIKVLFSVLFTLLLLEAGLRFFPEVIPLDLLIHFHLKPKAEIARNRGLPTMWDTFPLERDDGGPEIRLYKPFTIVAWAVEDYGTDSVVQMDDMGFCNPPDQSYHRSQIDIITLGDSFTACHAVNPTEAWTSKLGSLTGLSVYNLGRGGIGIHEYLQILKKFGLQKSPRVVIMNVYEGNDLRDAGRYIEYRRQAEERKKTGFKPTPTPSPNLLEDNSYTYNLAYATVQYLQTTEPADASVSAASQPVKEEINFRYSLVFSDKTVEFNPRNVDRDEVRNAIRWQKGEIDPEVFDTIEDALTTFVELSREYNFVPVMTYMPSVYTTYAENVAFDDPELDELMPWFSLQQRAYFEQKGEELGYIFYDLTPSLQASARAGGSGNLLYYRYDLHPTVLGHAAIAEAISQFGSDLEIFGH
jgi:hypothetical protein